MEKDFKVFNDDVTSVEMETALRAGKDLVIVSSPSQYFEGGAAQKAIMLMQKYPEQKIFVTSPVSGSILEQVLEKAASGASLLETYAYAEGLSQAQRA